MHWHREQYLELMTFGHVERPMFSELFGPLIGLEADGGAQGAGDDEINMTAFDWDYVPTINCGGVTRPIGPDPITLEESDTHLLQRDMLGRTLKLDKRTATIALPMNFPVRNMDDWRRLKPLFVFTPKHIDPDQIAIAKARQAQGAVVTAGIRGAFDTLRELMGEEMACLSYYDQPELPHDVIRTITDTALRVYDIVSREITIDHLSVHEDLAGKSGPLVGPAQMREYFRPYYRAVWDLLSSRGARVFGIDTDGNVNAIMDDLLDCGLTAMHPMEPAAGMDIVVQRRKYGRRLAMSGGLDKFVLSRSKADIRRELEYKMQPLLRDAGGIVFGLDHRIPNGTPLENYRYYVATGREILGLPPLNPKLRGWGRMAF